MRRMNWESMAGRVLAGERLGRDDALAVLEAPDDDLLAVLQAAFAVRRAHFGRGVSLHVIRNAKSGLCSEDCAFCSQSEEADTSVAAYPLQATEAIVAGARDAHGLGAVRYCVVTSGRGPAPGDLDRLCDTVRRIKESVPIQVCTSLGILTDGQAVQLKAAGVDRYNHNLETAEGFYPSICSTHAYADRVTTARAVKQAGMQLCSGGLIGMGESRADRVALAFALRDSGADSIPLNFLDPRPGTPLGDRPRITALDALRTLAMFRFVNPDRELRMAGGREACLGSLQALALFPANSIFTVGYLTTPGQGHAADLAMIAAAGFEVAEMTDA